MSARVLFIAYYFPPIGGAGTQRSLKFVKYLPQFGFNATVVTGPGTTAERFSPRDETFAEEIPSGVRIIRVAGPEPTTGRWTRRARAAVLRANRWEEWWIKEVRAASAEAGPFDIVYGTGPPYATLEAAKLVASDAGVPWIGDLRDLWALDEMGIYMTRLHRWHERRRMEHTLPKAAALITTAPTATAELRSEFPQIASRIITITNGYDANDFAAAPALQRRQGRFRIVHTGYLLTEEGLRQRQWWRQLSGGVNKDVDILTRSHVYLLSAVEKLLGTDPGLAERLEVCLAGVLSAADREIAARSKVTRILGYVPHADAIALMRSADLLFLPLQNKRGNRRSTTIPGKTFEYLATGRPILAAVPPGDARDLLADAGADLCAPDDTDEMARVIHERLERNETSQSRERAHQERFERARLAGKLAMTMEKTLNGGAA
jgi:glycosyltransferase involved in cell wall biosynthesis